jgi:hypothetical protein
VSGVAIRGSRSSWSTPPCFPRPRTPPARANHPKAAGRAEVVHHLRRDGAEFWRSGSVASQYTGRYGTDRLVGMIRGLIAKAQSEVEV